ncbi:tRNA (adenosine(37)-N6)-threonylcarbamoyltransferase complex dimerization subunit type 1 TsaB [Pleurocapsa sp. CCALA 161]|uniref:tRNA (adenosine(37)-N6)-threonylcarbamoyltransferase complex dimerization subunit type 1 TsaB n=1 Tax=Pleurocapsa sp. CCALA 161 TaxID=2107688 RepID=UPI000D083629|nr:tRNA (adenosine(37)-N6)-threonylcarbamoyltransferase complex dimerization subunit type 1 TsaB [Pleurocapsa sp. CCALA 161]PSB07045.1 tRNA (adenosine(37)-N6)-threonylcarbamoyltransferase complex dimerization subunit type 1 TsaB [Pleurocapsa sp. CCALA 161]
MPVLNSNQYAIALHTSTPQLGIAINNYAGDSRSQIWDLGRDLASQLHQHLAELLLPQTWQDLAFIAVAKGPGGFTGTRVGVVTARTIAQQLNIPLFGISNLAAIAAAQNYQGDHLLAVQMDARREQLFVGIYQITSQGLSTYMQDTLMTQAVWQQTLANLLSYQLIIADEQIAASVTNVLDLAYTDWQQGQHPHWSEITPYYGQHPVKG